MVAYCDWYWAGTDPAVCADEVGWVPEVAGGDAACAEAAAVDPQPARARLPRTVATPASRRQPGVAGPVDRSDAAAFRQVTACASESTTMEALAPPPSVQPRTTMATVRPHLVQCRAQPAAHVCGAMAQG